MLDSFLLNQMRDSAALKRALLEDTAFHAQLLQAAELCVEAYRAGRKLLIAGNGGSAGDAQHIAGELVGRFYFDRPALPALALTVDSSILTAIGNDYGYDYVFARQIEGNAVEGDVFLGISTSGNSANILRAIESAKQRGVKTIGLTGESGGKMLAACDVTLRMPSKETPRIQEGHLLVGHLLCSYIEHKVCVPKA